METKHHAEDTTDAPDKNLTCWQTATSPQCLRVETLNEVHLFPYGYFQHAKFIRQTGKEIVEIQFQDRLVAVKGKGLEALCDALERLAVKQINVRPEKYQSLGTSGGSIEAIEIKKCGKENSTNERQANESTD